MILTGQEQKISFVTGKGGVGKSTVAAGLAIRIANQGQRTLLVELGEMSYYQAVFNQSIGYQPAEVRRNLSVCIWNGENCLREYVLYILKIQALADLFFDNKVMRTFIKAAPALKELAILGKITSGVRSWGPELPFDHLVVDAPSTGHFLALLKAPLGMSELFEVGPMGEQSRSIMQVLKNQHISDYTIVTLLEDLPVSEALELKQDLNELLSIDPKIAVNRVYKSSVDTQTIEASLSAVQNKDNDFSIFVFNLLKEQERQMNRLSVYVKNYQVLPWVLSVNNQLIVDNLAEALHD